MRSVLTAALIIAVAAAQPAVAAPTQSTTHGPDSTSLNGSIVVGDLISGLIATELPGDMGWHGANADPADRLPALTDDAGMRTSGLTGLMNDFPGAGAPAKRIQYDLAAATDIARIHILSGNNGRDGRVFSTSVVSVSSDGFNFNPLGYFQSDPSGAINTPAAPGWGSTLVEIFDNGGGPLATGVTNLRFDLYAVDNTGGQMRDPFDGVNPFTGADDGHSAAFVSPLILEIDVIAVPEPATGISIVGMLIGGAAAIRRQHCRA